MSNILVLKLSDSYFQEIAFEDETIKKIKLKERLEGHWKVNLKELLSVTHVIGMYRGRVLADYRLGNNVTLERDTKRVTDLQLTDANNETGLVGEIINYKTANPSTIRQLDNLQSRIIHMDTHI